MPTLSEIINIAAANYGYFARDALAVVALLVLLFAGLAV
jgi:hypothetical protein